MLESIKIMNLALIDKSVINFTDGFNVLTGETGAGKSLIVDALLFLTGIRADKTLIKSGEDFAKVEGVFTIDYNIDDLNEILKSIDVENEGTLIISRYFTINGKNECRVNGEIVTLNILRKISSFLIDIFGQNDSQILLDPNNHLSLMDDIMKDKLEELKDLLATELNQLNDINNEIKELGGLDKDREATIELLQFQIKEIEDANLYDGKEDEIKSAIDRMTNSEKIFNALNSTIETLDGDVNLSSVLKTAINSLSSIEQYDDEIKSNKDRLYSIKYDLDDIVSSVSNMCNSIEYNEDELDRLQDDLSTIKDLERKYGNTIADIFETKDKMINRLNILFHSEEKLVNLKNDKKLTLTKIYDICNRLHLVRVSEYDKFKKDIVSELVELGMKSATFDIVFTNQFDLENIESVVTPNGADNIEFMFSANLGVEVRSLSKIISGGEMSRFMLAFKSLQNSNIKKTCIFDEIDTGIGGEIGVTIGKKIVKISLFNQVICITHLSQIASFGDSNFLIEKYEDNEKTITSVKQLNEDEKVIEISRMLGSSNNETSIAHAKEIISDAIEYKKFICNQ